MLNDKGLEIWGGVECTINRVGDSYSNQCEKSGHDGRLSDFDLFASLGLSRLRYPFLWEKAATPSDAFDWTWADQRMIELRRVGIKPIAGLLHHGSGPVSTHLLDPDFISKFARYAEAFATRFPEVDSYTPINEPLTTARFSALYGVWYPHSCNTRDFVQATLNQVLATREAMRAIRTINPQAKLVQTEDLGRARGTQPLQYQVNFENERRWLTFDLLCGKVNLQHPLYSFLIKFGAELSDLASLVDDPCPPDTIGINHYLLSNRFLDHRIERYPDHFHGGNGRHRYADVGAVDVRNLPLIPPKDIIQEASERYSIPIAVTEVHAQGDRQTQLQWFYEVYSAARDLKAQGANIQAVTAWSLLGSYDWNSLCTKNEGVYETGVFDLSQGNGPEETDLSLFIRTLYTADFESSDQRTRGWWHGSDRGFLGTTSTDELLQVFQINPLREKIES